MVDYRSTPFTTFAFNATGGTTPSTMPTRLAYVKNVKDFGALGDNSHDDTANIQAAIDWTANADRGTIYFPPGQYKTTSALTFNYAGALTIRFAGEGSASEIFGNFNGYIFDRALGSPSNYTTQIIFERLKVRNNNATGGGIRCGSASGTAIRDCIVNAWNSITTEDSAGVSSANMMLSNCTFAKASGNNLSGSICVIIGGGGAMEGCDIRTYAVGARFYGSGFSLNSGKMEVNNTAVELGLDSAGNDVGCSGLCIKGHTFEANLTAIDVRGLTQGLALMDFGIIGTVGGAGAAANANADYGIRFRADKILGATVASVIASGRFDTATIKVEDQTSRAYVIFTSTTAGTTSLVGGVAWDLGTKAHNAQLWNCNTVPIWLYSQLPTGANRIEGDEYDISDNNAGSAAFGTVVSSGTGTPGTGINRVRVRYNGTAWTVCGA